MLIRARDTTGAVPPRWLVPTLACVVAIALSSFRIVAAPGFEFYFGPLFYLIAWRWLGLKPALVAAVVTMAPSVLWWGHPISVLLAIGHVLAVDRYARDRRSFSTVTLVYQGIVGSAVGLVFLTLEYGSPIDVTVIVIARKILGELVVAGLADIAVLLVRYDRAEAAIRPVRHVSLQFSIDALVSMTVSGAATLFLLGQLGGIAEKVNSVGPIVSRAIAQWPERASAVPGGRYRLAIAQDAPAGDVLVARAGSWRGVAAAAGCRRFDTGPATIANDRNTFSYWLRLCVAKPLPGGKIAIVPIRPLVQTLFMRLGQGLAPLLVFLLVAQIALTLFRRAIRQSVDDWRSAIGSFRQRETVEPGHTVFAETAELKTLFAEASNNYLSADRERLRLSRAVAELRATMDLKLFGDVRFDRDDCALHFVKLDPMLGRREMTMAVSSADRPAFLSLAGQNDIMVEFRLGGGNSDDWYLLLAHDYDTALGGWRYGCVIRLRTSKAFQTQMRHNARLMELGGMASALSHELRQPLFTIALAAENGALLLDPLGEAAAPARRKFDRIVEQVDRATAIVQRTSAYARIERDEREPTDLLQTVQNAARFMRAVLQERDIHLSIVSPGTLPTLMLPRVGVEQIIVNALQNAADSIEAAHSERTRPLSEDRVVIRVSVDEGAVAIAIEDSGAGIQSEIAGEMFQAFSTTKPAGKGTGLGLFVCRQIIDEVGGTITLTDNDGRPGATLRMHFPLPHAAVPETTA